MKVMWVVGLVALITLGGAPALSGIGNEPKSDDGVIDCEDRGADAFERRFERTTAEGRERVDLKAETVGELQFEVEHESASTWSFRVEVCDLVEFEDVDGDGLFDRSEDRLVATVPLPSFGSVDYTVKGDEHVISVVSVDGRMRFEFRVVGSFADAAFPEWRPVSVSWSLAWDRDCTGSGMFGLDVDTRIGINGEEDRARVFHAAECGTALAVSVSA